MRTSQLKKQVAVKPLLMDPYGFGLNIPGIYIKQRFAVSGVSVSMVLVCRQCTYLDDCTGTTGAGEVIAPGVDPLVRCNLKCVTVVATE